jgi:MinD-like ATPase involved in chromosome partitioning or flagellar assembly
MVKSKEDIKVGNLIKMVSDKYLGINVNVLSHIPYEERVEKSIMCADPFLLNRNGNKFSASIREIALSMID